MKVEIVSKFSDTEYRVGIYTIECVDNGWVVMQGEKTIAVFVERHDALSWTNIHYTCGNLVGQGVRETLLIHAKERGV